MSTWRWLEHLQNQIPAEKNMAVDQALLDSVIDHRELQAIRVYTWPDSYVTYGRLQRPEDVTLAFPGLKPIARPTGGRAVVHNNDLTVTVAANEGYVKSYAQTTGVLSSYHVILSGIIDTLNEFGTTCASGNHRLADSSQDCFASIGKCDVIDVGNRQKIVGSAQLRTRQAILQQMSIRPHARYHTFTIEFIAALKDNLARRLHIQHWDDTGGLSVEELARAGLS